MSPCFVSLFISCSCFCNFSCFIFMSSHFTGSCPTSDDASVLSVIQPTAAATAREQQCISGLFFDTDWISAATGDLLNQCQTCMLILYSISWFPLSFPYIIDFEKHHKYFTLLSIFFHILPSACCMIISLGPAIQVLLSCLHHSTQSIFTSSIRPHAYLFSRYSIEDKANVCR